jgi:colanic acid biosynthesis glycosyl transferase WcaI
VIVAAQQRSELALIVQESGGGLVIPPDDPQGLADAVQSLRERPALRAVMGDSGRSYALSHMSRESILGNFAKKLAAIA